MQPSLRIPVIALFSLTGACGRTDAFPGLAIPDPYSPDAGVGDTADGGAADTSTPDGAEPDAIEPDSALPDTTQPDSNEPDVVDPDDRERLRQSLRVFAEAYCDADCRGYGQAGAECDDAVYEQIGYQTERYDDPDCLEAWAVLLDCIAARGECVEVEDPNGTTYSRFAAPYACSYTYYGVPEACG